MKKKSFICFKRNLFVILFLMSLQSINAQDTIQSEQIDEVIISASRSEQISKDVGRSTTVISQEDIQNSVYSNVSELLSQHAGIYILGTGQTPGSLQSIYMRGTGNNQTVILIDGIRITDPSSVDNAVNLSELTLANIERIEIVRGTHSTLYGSSSIGGIINIITKKGVKEGVNAYAEIKAGTFGKLTKDISESLYINYTSKYGLYANGELLKSNIDGLDATTDTITDPGQFISSDRDNFDRFDLVGKIGYKTDKWDMFASYKYINHSMDIDDGAFKDDDNNKVNFTRNLLSYQVSFNPSEKFLIKFLGGYTEMNRVATDDSSLTLVSGTYDHSYSSDRYFGTILNNEVQANYKIKGLSVLFGIGNYEESMTINSYFLNTAWALTIESSLDTLNIRSLTNTAFLHTNINGSLISDHIDFIGVALGGRYNFHSSYGKNYTFEINPSIKINKNAMIYTLYSTGFNAPSLYRLYSPQFNYISNIKRGNSGLNPEKSTSIEFGIKQSVRNFEFNISFFQTKIENLIEYVYLWDNEIDIDELGNDWLRDDFRGDTYINIGEQINKGFELSVRSKLNNKISVSGNISLINGSLSYDPNQNSINDGFHVQLFNTGDFLNKQIELQGLTRRSNTANLFVNYMPLKKLNLSADVKYVGQRKDIYYNSDLGPYGALGQIGVGEYTLFGFTVGYQIMKNLHTTFRIDNLLNTKYQEIIGYNTKGRGIYLKVSYSI